MQCPGTAYRQTWECRATWSISLLVDSVSIKVIQLLSAFLEVVCDTEMLDLHEELAVSLHCPWICPWTTHSFLMMPSGSGPAEPLMENFYPNSVSSLELPVPVFCYCIFISNKGKKNSYLLCNWYLNFTVRVPLVGFKM